jgi:hypothetical protein
VLDSQTKKNLEFEANRCLLLYVLETGLSPFEGYSTKIEQVTSFHLDQRGYDLIIVDPNSLELPRGYHGHTDYNEKTVYVEYKRFVTETTLAHELHHVLTPIEETLKNKKLSEDKAKFFSRCILAPKDHFVARFEVLKRKFQKLKKLFTALAYDFRVSCGVVILRALDFGYISQNEVDTLLEQKLFPTPYV